MRRPRRAFDSRSCLRSSNIAPMFDLTITLQNDQSHRMMLGVTECDQSGGHAALPASSSAGPLRTRKGSPLGFFRTSMSRQPIAFPIPVPNAFETASFAAKRAARWRAGNFIDIEYSISPVGKNAMEKSFAKPVERMLNPRTFHQIHAHADDTHVAMVKQALRLPELKTTTAAFALQFSKSLRFTHDNPPSPRAFRARRFATQRRSRAK